MLSPIHSTHHSTLYIGLMSGTSADGIDAVLVDFSTPCHLKILQSYFKPYSRSIQTKIIDLVHKDMTSLNYIGELEQLLTETYSQTVNTLLKKSNLTSNQIMAIGCHGQTIFHSPLQPNPFTWQLCDGSRLARETNIHVICDVRSADLAAGGQGAPLAPGLHEAIFSSATSDRAVVNIGGISNITLLPNTASNAKGKHRQVIGYDTGPGNGLMDYWTNKQWGQPYDIDGDIAKSGQISKPLLNHLLNDPYFKLSPPKSTGREYFSSSWLETRLSELTLFISDVDVLTTLTFFTAITISDAILQHKDFKIDGIYMCGGGAKNKTLMNEIKKLMPTKTTVDTTLSLGMDPDLVEAVLMAWIAHRTSKNQTANVPSVTGATKAVILGTHHMAQYA